MSIPGEAYDQPVPVEWKLLASLRADEPTITNTEVAKRIGVNINTITRWLKNPVYQRYENFVLGKTYDALPESVKEEIRGVNDLLSENSVEMTERLYAIIQATNDPKLEAELAQDWLDRAGFAPQRKVANDGKRPIIMTPEAMEVFFQRAGEAGLLPEGRRDQAPAAPAIDVQVERVS
jgi:transposase